MTANPVDLAHMRPPRFKLPAGAVDTHCHVFGPSTRFPYAAGRSYTPVDCPKEAMAELHAFLGVSRAVVIQPSAHGPNNDVMLDMVRWRPGDHRGVALADDTFSDRRFRELHEGGVRGVRFNLLRQAGVARDVAMALRVIDRVAGLEMGWHAVLHVDGPDIAELTPSLRKLRIPFAIDHMGRINSSLGVAQPDFVALLELAKSENCWIKISDSPRISPPPFPAGVPMAAAIIAAIPDRVLWGSDLPHPDPSHSGEISDVVDMVPLFAPTPELQRKLLVDNPARLYGFADQKEAP